MKKTLQGRERAFLVERKGKVEPEEVCIEEIVAAVNRGVQGEWANTSQLSVVLRMLHQWICRYIEEGATESFLNDLNFLLRQVQYSNYVVPSDFYYDDAGQPESIFVANMNLDYSPEVFAAKEFSRFITYGMLKNVRRCQCPGCEKIFLGRPQSKWCSTTCGSKYRVGKKRRKDSR